MKKPAIVLGLILIVFSSARIALETRFGDDAAIHRLFLHYWVGSDRRLLALADALQKQGTPREREAALLIYRDTLARNPGDPQRWCDLGAAFLDSGRADEARTCYRHAVEFGPNNIQTLWQAAEFYARDRQPHDALRLMCHILERAPGTSEAVFYSYLQGGYEFADTLAAGLPEERLPAQAYLRYLMRFSAEPQAEQCWIWIAARSFADDKLAGDYAAFLLRMREYRKARDAWAAYLGDRGGDYLKSNFLYNAGLESEPCGSPFDWSISGAPGVDAARDREIRHSGRWSLRIEFDGTENVAYRHVSQSVYLEPGSYRLRGWLRTEGITTDQGIGFRIAPLSAQGYGNAATEPVTGTHDWMQVETTLDLKEAGLVRVEIFRRPSEKFNNKIAGTAWVDDLELSIRDSKFEIP